MGRSWSRTASLKDGRRVVLSPLEKGEPDPASQKSPDPGSGALLSSLLEEGKRAVTLRVDDVRGVAGFIRPGDCRRRRPHRRRRTTPTRELFGDSAAASQGSCGRSACERTAGATDRRQGGYYRGHAEQAQKLCWRPLSANCHDPAPTRKRPTRIRAAVSRSGISAGPMQGLPAKWRGRRHHHHRSWPHLRRRRIPPRSRSYATTNVRNTQ